MPKTLEVNNLKKYYGTKNNITKAVNDLSLEVEKGEFTAIMGASGSGKTTLLNCISTIDEVTSGHIFVSGKDITEVKEKDLAKFRRENLGFIFQDFNLLDTLTISENISLALIINKEDVNKVEEKVTKIAEKLGIKEILNKYPYEVSGGQKQRCACARALINQPELILADEPTGALDDETAKQILKVLEKLARKDKMTVIIITHNSAIAPIADKIIRFKNGKAESTTINKNPQKVEDINW